MDPAPDSPYAEGYTPSLGIRRGTVPKREGKPTVIVVHTTGLGPIRRHELGQPGCGTPFDAAMKIYTRIYKYSGHYVLDGESGRLMQVVPEDYAAQHVGVAKTGLYETSRWKTDATAWWPAAFPGVPTPLSLPCWEGGSCNQNAIGIEVVPRLQEPRGPWSDTCWTVLGELLGDLATWYDIPWDTHHILSHSQAHPVSRSNRRLGPWDPTADAWTPERLHINSP